MKAIGELPKDEPVDPDKNPAAVTLGRLGGLKGGAARAKSAILRVCYRCQ